MSSIINSHPNKIAVSLYLYHIDLWEEFKELLFPLSDDIVLYLGLCKDHDNKYIINDLISSNIIHHITYHNNYGVDVAPFLQHLTLIQEPVFIKLHSKKSYWGFKGHINWRYIILNDLIGSRETLFDNISILDKKNNGLLCNKSMLFNNREYTNTEHIKQICSVIKIDYDFIKNGYFVGGNMFMSKTFLFKKYLSPYINDITNLLSQETGKISDNYNGTYSHAMERIFGYIVSLDQQNFCYPNHRIIRVMNNSAPNKQYFSMITLYNQYCYIEEDINLYGKILDCGSKNITIEWYHMNSNVVQQYSIISSNTIKKNEY